MKIHCKIELRCNWNTKTIALNNPWNVMMRVNVHLNVCVSMTQHIEFSSRNLVDHNFHIRKDNEKLNVTR